MKFDKAEMRTRFWKVTDEIDAVVEEVRPLKEERDKLLETLDPLKKQFKKICGEIETKTGKILADKKAEQAMLARALGTKVGARPDTEKSV